MTWAMRAESGRDVGNAGGNTLRPMTTRGRHQLTIRTPD